MSNVLRQELCDNYLSARSVACYRRIGEWTYCWSVLDNNVRQGRLETFPVRVERNAQRVDCFVSRIPRIPCLPAAESMAVKWNNIPRFHCFIEARGYARLCSPGLKRTATEIIGAIIATEFRMPKFSPFESSDETRQEVRERARNSWISCSRIFQLFFPLFATRYRGPCVKWSRTNSANVVLAFN